MHRLGTIDYTLRLVLSARLCAIFVDGLGVGSRAPTDGGWVVLGGDGADGGGWKTTRKTSPDQMRRVNGGAWFSGSRARAVHIL